MKRVFLFVLVCLLCFTACIAYVIRKIDNPNNISINISDSEDEYRIKASYKARQSARVQRYLSDKLHCEVFKERKAVNYLVLDDQTRLYIKTSPGRLLIKMDKNDNSFESYFKMKEVAEGIKRKLTED